MTDNCCIKICVPEWFEEHDQAEIQISSFDDLIKLREQGVPIRKVARLAIIARERGLAPDDILPENDKNLNTGSEMAIYARLRFEKVKVQLENERTVEVQKYVAPVRGQEEDHWPDEPQTINVPPAPAPPPSDKLVQVFDPAAARRAEQYLFGWVLGHIRNRLTTIAVGKGDVRDVAERLKRAIDEIVAELV